MPNQEPLKRETRMFAGPIRAIAWMLDDGALVIAILAFLYYASPLFAAFSLYFWAAENSRRMKYYFFTGLITFPVSAYLCSDEKWWWPWSLLLFLMHFAACATLFFIYSRKNTDGYRSRLNMIAIANKLFSALKDSRRVLLVAAMVVLVAASAALLMRNKNYTYYEECILDKIKDANTVAAANMVRNACSALYPKKN